MARYNAGLIPASPTVVSGVTAFGTHVNPFLTAVLSGFAGTTRSDGVAAGHVWSKEVAGGYQVNMFVGSSTDVPMGTVTTATGKYALTIDMIEAGLTSSGRGVPTGTLIMHAANTAPAGYLKANGASVSRTTYAALFAVIGTTYGSISGTTFNLPDMRGEFPRGWDDGRGVDSGRAFGSAQGQQIQSHDHAAGTLGGTTDSQGAHTHTIGSNVVNAGSTGNVFQGGVGGLLITTTTTSIAGAHAHSVSVTGTTAASGSAETRPRNLATLFCIKF